MATTGVLPFVRGVDFSKNDFQDEKFPERICSLTGLRWLRLNNVGLENIPSQITQLDKVEHLSVNNNKLHAIPSRITTLQNLRVLRARNNNLTNYGVPIGLFELEDLSTVDLSYNNLKECPAELENARTLLVLNLSNNEIEVIPNQVFINLTDLMILDLSNNKLETLPPQMRRLTNLQTLILNNNPMLHAQLRQLPALVNLQCLHMRNTQRTISNMPAGVESLTNLCDVDVSQNELPAVPEALYKLEGLKRLNLADNNIRELSNGGVEMWAKLETLNLSRNQLKVLPQNLTKCVFLKRLYVNCNELTFGGIPAGIGKLFDLEVFEAASNNLEMIPEGLCRCGKLRRLILNNNRLYTLPETIHYLTELETLQLDDNPDMTMPAKPPELNPKVDEFYNIDFTLDRQLRDGTAKTLGVAGATTTSSSTDGGVGARTSSVSSTKEERGDPLARKKRLQRMGMSRKESVESESDKSDLVESSKKVLRGMKDMAKVDKTQLATDWSKEGEKRPKAWQEHLQGPRLSYRDIYDPEVGQIPGIEVWEIENFLPNPLDEYAFGKFFNGDCYIVLNTTVHEEHGNLNWAIYFWIGETATLDKKACAAMHAVNLRNFLGARCRTIREEQGDESDDFLALFDFSLTYIDGGRTPSGFYAVEEKEYITRFYRVSGSVKVELTALPQDWRYLDSRNVYILDSGLTIFIWNGDDAKGVTKAKARLMGEKINKFERKGEANLYTVTQGNEPDELWELLGGQPDEEIGQGNAIPDPYPPRLYQVGLGQGYLELPQVHVPHNKLTQKVLDSKHVYILDCITDIFVWIGKKSTRFVRAAAVKLSQELCNMLNRPKNALITRILENTESQIFKSKFINWDDVLAVDYSRAANEQPGMVPPAPTATSTTGVNKTETLKKNVVEKPKADLTALFMPRQTLMTEEEAVALSEEWNEELDRIESFVLEGNKFIRLPDEEFGLFHSGDCYVFLCRYWVPPEETPPKEGGGGEEDEEEEEEQEEDFKCVVYFWQGRDASNMGWLNFTFSLQKKFETLFGDKLEVVKQFQQQENIKFLSHFKRKFVIRQTRRKEEPKEGKAPIELFHLRANGGPLCTRCIQVEASAASLHSAHCYVLRVPFDAQGTTGITYVWKGNHALPQEARVALDIATDLNKEGYSLQEINEGEEPENFFWVGLGGKKPYDTSSVSTSGLARLFRCSNEKGFFAVTEKCADFCQDDLPDEDIMILDSGEEIFIWVGPKASQVELKLAYKSAQTYLKALTVKGEKREKKLFLTVKNKESRRFTRNFHAWAHHKSTVVDPVEEKRLIQKAIMKRKMQGAREAISSNVAAKSSASGSSKLLRQPPPPPIAAPGGWRGPEEPIPEGADETDA